MSQTKKVVFCTLQFEAVHCWPNCHIEDVSFLRVKHRHMFHVKAFAEVNHDDRDVEFIWLKRMISEWIQRKYQKTEFGYLDLGPTSCETIATDIMNQFGLVRVEVNEDNENGAIVWKEGF